MAKDNICPSKIPCIRLNTGDTIPIVGFGTVGMKGEDVQKPIEWCIDAGYHHIDTAHAYENEMEIGTVLRRLMDEGKTTRRGLFITSKLWNTFHRPDLVRPAFDQTLRHLQLDYIDLYLIHTPCAFAEETDELFPRNGDKTIRFSSVDYVDTWLEMKKLYDDGLARNIGVANFNIEQLQRIIATGFVPAVLQIECNPFCVQTDLLQFCAAHGIRVTAHSPLGQPSRLIGFNGVPKLLFNKTVQDAADAHGKTAGQILIRYQIQKGHSVLPTSMRELHIRSNIDVFDFDLTADEMHALGHLEVKMRSFLFMEYVYSCPFI